MTKRDWTAEGWRTVEPEELEPFLALMKDKVIPEIIRAVQERQRSAEEARKWFIAHGTEQTMHAAWRKRAEEAEERERLLLEEMKRLKAQEDGHGDATP